MNGKRQLKHLFAETEELLAELADSHTPDVQQIRERLQQSIDSFKETSAPREPGSRVKARDVAGSLNDYVQSYPWLALATGVLVASTIGILATKATKRSLHH